MKALSCLLAALYLSTGTASAQLQSSHFEAVPAGPFTVYLPAKPGLKLELGQAPVAVVGYGFKSDHAMGGVGLPVVGYRNSRGDDVVRAGLFALGGNGSVLGPGLWFPTGSLGQHVQNAFAVLVPKQAGNLDWLRAAGDYVSVGIGYNLKLFGSSQMGREVVALAQVNIPLPGGNP